jgi:hypothetical protein
MKRSIVAATSLLLMASVAHAAPYTPDVNPQPGVGHDFIADARLLWRVAACGGGAPVEAPLDEKVVAAHCKKLTALEAAHRDKFVAVAKPYIAALRPAATPRTVVYPFGGGDLLSALTAFPDAVEITTISLEYSGDPRRLAALSSKTKLRESLQLLIDTMHSLLRGDWELSRNMKITQRGELPGELGYDLVALVIHGYQPVSLRYFTFTDDGGIHYLSKAELEVLDGKAAKALRGGWVSPDYSEAYAHMELRFQPVGGGPVKVFRHVAWNLDDKHLTQDPRLLKHLAAKGMVAMLTRAGAFMLWGRDFSAIRDYMTSHLVWCVSDTTGVPPPFAAQAGLEQIPFGKFDGAFEPTDQSPRREYNKAWSKLWRERRPVDALPFRFGYPDINGHAHMVVTLRPTM